MLTGVTTCSYQQLLDDSCMNQCVNFMHALFKPPVQQQYCLKAGRLILQSRERGPMGGALYFRLRQGGRPTFVTSILHLPAKDHPL